MKRSPALEPFSRDHNDSLILARQLETGAPDAESRIIEAWNLELKDHFDEEERLLIPLLPESMSKQLKDEHRQIARRISHLPDGCAELGQALTSHVRWEERVLFPYVEEHATEAELDNLLKETTELELRRWEKDKRRAKLVARRWQRSVSE